LRTICCELYTKIQKMKAIHNLLQWGYFAPNAVNYTQRYKKWKQFTTYDTAEWLQSKLWTIHKDTKNESNSQLEAGWADRRICCELYTKIQKMKAIHNYHLGFQGETGAVNYTQRYKKWKQFTTSALRRGTFLTLWTIHKDTKNESNSQRTRHNPRNYVAVNYTQRYKKWKQFTTGVNCYAYGEELWTIHKDTKNESNSQRRNEECNQTDCCELYTKIQKMKAIHNTTTRCARATAAVNYTQRYKKWKQFTT